LAHLWHDPFRVAEKIGEYAVNLEIAGSAYNIFPIVHVAKIKPVREFPDRPDLGYEDGQENKIWRILREFLEHWRGDGNPDLNCGAILHEILRDRANQNRFGAMQSHEEAWDKIRIGELVANAGSSR
ncbi:hypothetical protein PHMEG_00036289, partial [Phytophthora megakarya]